MIRVDVWEERGSADDLTRLIVVMTTRLGF